MAYLIVAALAFAVCYGLDKGFTRLFRNKKEHRSGRAVKHHKRLVTIGLLLTLVGLGFGCAVIQLSTGWLMNRKNSKEQQAFEMLNLTGYNIGVFAMPFVGGFLGSTGVLTCSLFDGGSAVMTLL